MNDEQCILTPEEIERFRINSAERNTYETGLTRQDRYILNMFHMRIIEYIEKELEK